MNPIRISALFSPLLIAAAIAVLASCGDAGGNEDTGPVVIPQDSPIISALNKGVSARITEEGATYFVLKKCNNCHKTKGTIKTVGPVLAGIKDRMTIPELEAWIRHPRRMKPGTLMPTWDGRDHELISLIAYIRTL